MEITEQMNLCVISYISCSYCVSCFIVPALRSAVTEDGKQEAQGLQRSVCSANGTAVIGDFSVLRPNQFFLRYICITKVGVGVCVCGCHNLAGDGAVFITEPSEGKKM
jgi:hypothetical protein